MKEASQEPGRIQAMFNDIAPTYDLLNHILSFGLDRTWRRKAISCLAKYPGGRFLDIASGSGDVALDLLRLSPRQVVAGDFAYGMLRVFGEKLRHGEALGPIDIVSCDALNLPFRDNLFDGTVVAFGIRNFADRGRSLREMHRVLRPGGTSVILELTEPRGFGVAHLYRLYSRFGLPIVGRIVSRNSSAYHYLPDSISTFPAADEFLAMMAGAGFHNTRVRSLTFGSAAIYTGEKA